MESRQSSSRKLALRCGKSTTRYVPGFAPLAFYPARKPTSNLSNKSTSQLRKSRRHSFTKRMQLLSSIARFADVSADRGERSVGVSPASVAVEVDGRIRRIPRALLDRLTICRPVFLDLCAGDKLQLKANAIAARGQKLANGEIVTVAAVTDEGAIKLTDGRTLPPAYRQFLRGYAVTSYGSQGKTVDHVLFADAAVRAATNAQQWYVTISRGRKGIQIFTADKEQLRHAIARTGNRELALDLVGFPARQRRVGETVLLGLRRGREFARRVCHAAMRRWTAAFFKQQTHQLNETSHRNRQTNDTARPNVLAARNFIRLPAP